MICGKCNKETEEGKFCMGCGAALSENETAATIDPVVGETFDPEPIKPSIPMDIEKPKQENEYVEKLKSASSNFVPYFLDLMQKPSSAKEKNHKDLTSGITVIVMFSLIIALQTYIILSSFSGIFGSSATFLDGFFLPLIKFVALFGLIAILTFSAAKVAKQDLTITDTIAKYGSYLVPFLLLHVVGIIFSLIGLTVLSSLITIVSLIGSVLIIPTLILTEKPVKGFDLVYVLIALSIVSFAIFGYLASHMLGTLIGGMLNSFF